MKIRFLPTFLAVAAIAIAPAFAGEPVKLIFDTDMGNDIDDAMALAIIHQLERRGVVELLAVTSTKDNPKSAAFIDAINTFYGYPDVPIGVVRDGVAQEEGRYNGLADLKDEAGKPIYPHDLKSGEEAPEAVSLLRKTLAAQPDGSVKIAQVGFFTNLAQLLESKPDEHSPLSGADLIKKKVKELVIMAGSFQTIRFDTDYAEYNVREDVPSAQLFAEKWPTTVIWSGYEIGIAAAYPWQSIMEDYGYVDHHIIKEGYLAWVQDPPHDRPTWDLTAVLYAVYPDRGYFDLSPMGSVTVNERGRTDFIANDSRQKGVRKEGGNDRYLIMSEVQAARVREAFVQLCSEPPAGSGDLKSPN
ncbi:MAG: nucleoside hydrolase [Verrucomicrobiae bacterium]|nr:nucleoside hydrolase [Verrucomicrobiae bacterium]